MTDGNGDTTYELDALGRPITITQDIGGAVSYRYDDVGNRTQIIYPDGKTATYLYNEINQITSVTDWDGGVTGYQYDDVGRPITITFPNGAGSSLTYDVAGNILNITHNNDSGGVIGSYSYSYDGTGRRVGAVETGNVITYTYDALYRLTNAAESGGDVYHYEYDAAGNRLLKQESGVTQSATYDAANQLATLDGWAMVYDGNGNLLDDGTQVYQYDDLDRLIRVTQGISATLYGYNGDSDRLWQNTNGVTTTFTLDLNGALAQVLEQTQGGQTSSFLPGIGQESNGGLWYFYHTDALGSVRHMSGVTGGSIGDVKYSPFGEIVDSTGIMPWFGFTGEQQDSTSGLTYLRSRYYNPALGRFLTPDSLIPDLTNGQALNAYAYVYNDPINLVDPSGHFGIRETVRTGIKDFASGGINFIDNWYSKPDDCSCDNSGSTPQSITSALSKYVLAPASGLTLSVITDPVQRFATRVDVYSRLPASTRFGRIGMDSYVRSYNNMNITNLKLVDYGTQANTYNNGAGGVSKVMRMQDGRKLVLHNTHTRWNVDAINGANAAILGSGLLDGALQVYGDWASGLCLSNNQRFWRGYAAMISGLGMGAIGVLFTGILVGAGLPTLAAGIGGFLLTTYVANKLEPHKNNYINAMGNVMGDW